MRKPPEIYYTMVSFVYLQKLAPIRARVLFEGWLRRIFVNLALENFRKEKKKESLIEDYKYISISEADYDDSEEINIMNIPTEEVLEMIRALPDGYRTVFNLYVFEDMSHKEIGKQLGIKESASRSQFFRARNILKEKILARQNSPKSLRKI
jgi:RNA polymerase sigma-70 factor (ECF subfamily)